MKHAPILILINIALLLSNSALAQKSEKSNEEVAAFFMEEVTGDGKEIELPKEVQIIDFVSHSEGNTYTFEQNFQSSLGSRRRFPDLAVKSSLLVEDNDVVLAYGIRSDTNCGRMVTCLNLREIKLRVKELLFMGWRKVKFLKDRTLQIFHRFC